MYEGVFEMRIIYITTSLEENDYNDFNKAWKVTLNPSNQNFHNKMIRSLATLNDVEVISIRPFSRPNCSLKRLKEDRKKIGNITYNYLKIRRSKLFRMPLIKKQSNKLLEKMDLKDTVIVTDTINPRCTNLGSYLQRKYKLPTIGICTDSPSNITGTTKSYTLYLLQKTSKFDGFVTLTEGLNFLYNLDNKKHITLPGVVEEEKNIKDIKVDGKYFFFGGALLPRYGIYNLIEAFKQIEDKDISLLICGHHSDDFRLNEAIQDNPRIKYLGILPVQDVLVLEKNAFANINPRPFTQDLDRLSVPSKTLEYLASGSLTISVKNTELEKVFKREAIWAKSGEVSDLLDALNRAINMKEEDRKNMANKAKKTAISRYSIQKIGEILTDFLSSFLQ